MGTPVARIKRTSDTSFTTELQFHGLADHTIAAVDTGGTVNASFRYAPLGEVLESADVGGASAHRRRFDDKQQDELTGLSYYGARYYDKTLMGWTQGDPRYRYAPDDAWKAPRRALLYTANLNNALRYKDSDGRDVALVNETNGSITVQVGSIAVTTSNLGVKVEATGAQARIGDTVGVELTALQAAAGFGFSGFNAELVVAEAEASMKVGPAKLGLSLSAGVGFKASWDRGVVSFGIKAGVGAELEVDVGAIAGALAKPLPIMEWKDQIESDRSHKVKEGLAELEAGLAASDRALNEVARAERAKAERATAERDQRTSKAAEGCGANAECLRQPAAQAE